MQGHPTARALRAAAVLPWRAHRGMFAAQLLVMVAVGLAPVAAAWLLRAVLDSLTGGGRHVGLLFLIVALAVANGVQEVLPSFGQYLTDQSGRAIERLATTELFGAVGRLAGLRRLEDPVFLDRLNMAQRVGMSGPGQRLQSSAVGVVQATLTVTGFMGALLVLSPVMAVVMLAATIPAMVAEASVARRNAAMLAGISHAERRQYFYASLLSSLAAAKEIRLFGLGLFFRRAVMLSDELRVIQRGRSARRPTSGLWFTACLAALSAMVAGAGIWWAVSATARGRLTVGDLSLFVAALAAAGSALTMIVSNASMAYQAVLTFRSYTDIVAEGPDLALPADPARRGRSSVASSSTTCGSSATDPICHGSCVGSVFSCPMARQWLSSGVMAPARARWSS